MTANKLFLRFFIALIGVASFGSSALASGGSAPSLLGVEEIVVQNTRLGQGGPSAACGIISSNAVDAVLKKLKSEEIQAFSVMSAPRANDKVARVELLPEIVSLQRQGLDCVSWVALTAQTRETVALPPIKIPRNLSVTYWRAGLLISSTQIAHARAVYDALGRLAVSFAKQHRLDQPPPLPDFGE